MCTARAPVRGVPPLLLLLGAWALRLVEGWDRSGGCNVNGWNGGPLRWWALSPSPTGGRAGSEDEEGGGGKKRRRSRRRIRAPPAGAVPAASGWLAEELPSEDEEDDDFAAGALRP